MYRAAANDTHLDSPPPARAFGRASGLAEQEVALRILVAEDSGELRRLIALVLRRDGHEVIEARNGAELLEAMAVTFVDRDARRPDVIICEHLLPGIPGLTALAGLRARDPAMPFILMRSRPS